MKQVVQNYKSGELRLLDVPAPLCRPGGVLVQTEHSLISAGTEKMKVSESRMSLVGMAKARPDQVRKVIETVSQQGVASTYRKVMNRLDSFTPLGYSLAGIVVEVGDGVTDFTVGQRVACGGNLYAHHAELNWVPRNLCVPVPDTVSSAEAAFTTVGAIAMQAFRQSDARLGETAVVIGLGLVGQLIVQILRSAAVHVVGIDPSAERCAMAVAAGAAEAGPGDEPTAIERAVAALSHGSGADHVFLAASTDQREPLFTAAALARDRARIVDVGKCNLDLPWNEYYEKELDVRFSRSYGPGRYDPIYEEGGIDYPIGYVRWTERRNMGAFLDLVAQRRVDLSILEATSHPFADAASVYDQLHEGTLGGVAVLFAYEPGEAPETVVTAPAPPVVSRDVRPSPVVRLGVIGAGNYASTMLLPHLVERPDIDLTAVATTTALSSATAQERFGFRAATTDYRKVLEDESINAVLIATRHDTHARIAAEALRAGKAVFVEKPLAVSPDQLAELVAVVAETGNDRIQVGFNRRFAPLLNAMRSAWGRPAGPTVFDYQVRAGALAADSWYRRTEEQGSRFVGEGCHFVDTASWWLGADPIDVIATATPDDPDNLHCTLRYPDGSLATITYLTSAAPKRYPKETITVHAAGSAARFSNFSSYDLWKGGRRRPKRTLTGVDKGQAAQLAKFLDGVLLGTPMPIPFASLLATTDATFAAHRSAASGERVRIGAGWTPSA